MDLELSTDDRDFLDGLRAWPTLVGLLGVAMAGPQIQRNIIAQRGLGLPRG